MFDPTVLIVNTKWIGVTLHCKTDYYTKIPLSQRLNLLRYQIGIGDKRPRQFVFNKNAHLAKAWSNLNWKLWKRQYRKKFGYPSKRK